MSRPLVLVVEDEADIRELVSYNLTKAGYQVTSVVTGEEAMAAVETDPPGLVVLDLMLPGMDGLTVCQRLKRDAKTESIPIVMLTAKSQESDKFCSDCGKKLRPGSSGSKSSAKK